MKMNMVNDKLAVHWVCRAVVHPALQLSHQIPFTRGPCQKKVPKKWFKENTHYIKVNMLFWHWHVHSIFLSIAGYCAPIVSDAQNWKGVMLPKKMVDEGWWFLPMPKNYPPIIILYAFSILYGIKVPSSESSKIAKGNSSFPKICNF